MCISETFKNEITIVMYISPIFLFISVFSNLLHIRTPKLMRSPGLHKCILLSCFYPLLLLWNFLDLRCRTSPLPFFRNIVYLMQSGWSGSVVLTGFNKRDAWRLALHKVQLYLCYTPKGLIFFPLNKRLALLLWFYDLYCSKETLSITLLYARWLNPGKWKHLSKILLQSIHLLFVK